MSSVNVFSVIAKRSLLKLFACSAMALLLPGAAMAASSQAALDKTVAAERAALQELYDAARAAGQKEVNFYPGVLGFEPIAAKFQEAFPDITVNTQVVIGGKRVAQLDSEFAVGKVTVDLAELGPNEFARYHKDGRLATWDWPARHGVPGDFIYKDTGFSIYGDLKGAAWNTNAVKDEEVPKSYKDLFTKDWIEKIGFQRPTGGGLVQYTLVNLFALGALKEEDIARFTVFKSDPAQANLISGLAQGTYDFLPLTTSATILNAQKSGAPFRLGVIDDFNWLSWGVFAQVKDGPNPLSAKLLLAWLLSHDGQAAVAGQSFYSIYPEIPLQEGLPPLASIKLHQVDFETQQKVAPQVREITQKYWK